jgi:hypothetical protein
MELLIFKHKGDIVEVLGEIAILLTEPEQRRTTYANVVIAQALINKQVKEIYQRTEKENNFVTKTYQILPKVMEDDTYDLGV